MNATTPPKLMPPFHSTAASGTLPIEQTNDAIATIGPMIGPHSAAKVGWSVRKKVLPERVRHPRGDGAGDQQPDDEVAQDRGPLHDEHVRHRGEAVAENEPPPKASPSPCTDMSIAAWPSIDPASPRSACSRAASMMRERTNSRNSTASTHDHERAADELGGGELPAHQQGQDDAELDDQVGRGDLEGHRRGEVRALAEQRPGQRHRRVRARRRRGTQTGRDRKGAGPVVAEQSPRSSTCAPPPARPPTARSPGSTPTGSPRSSTRPGPRRDRSRRSPNSPVIWPLCGEVTQEQNLPAAGDGEAGLPRSAPAADERCRAPSHARWPR